MFDMDLNKILQLNNAECLGLGLTYALKSGQT